MHEPSAARRSLARLDALDAALINRLQGTLPLVSRPFTAVAGELGCSEAELLDRLHRLLGEGTLTRFGPLFQIERAGGRFVLAALQVPQDRYEAVTALVNAHPEVAHNYRREHRLNMWFVLATEQEVDVARAVHAIEAETGLEVWAFPKEREYFVGLHLPARATTEARP
ncbi:MAG TPA: Lrp/AsnC family transcriptional regulator [Burkholderiaceae bacterium]|nr:Lrp/AsnC family transcriptional regulator [Burkholderiaceae bacterium]